MLARGQILFLSGCPGLPCRSNPAPITAHHLDFPYVLGLALSPLLYGRRICLSIIYYSRTRVLCYSILHTPYTVQHTVIFHPLVPGYK